MQWQIFDTDDKLSEHAAHLVAAELNRKNDLVLGAATGASPEGLYKQLAARARLTPALFGGLRVVQLDEWGGLLPSNPASCADYLKKYVCDPLKVTPDRYVGWNGASADTQQECERMQEQLRISGPMDLCILGLGLNGHIAFNEPGSCLQPHAHLARLTSGSQRHDMVETLETKPAYGLTLGMADILGSRTILLLISGSRKREITGRLKTGQVSTDLPASFLWLHSNTICLIDKDAYE